MSVSKAWPLVALLIASLTAARATAQTEITFRFNDPEAPQMRQALDVFEKENPGVKVTLQRISWADAQQQYLREAAVGAGPDVAQLAFVWPRSFGAAGALLPLDDYIKKTGIGVKGWQDFVSRDLAVGPDGKIYGIPWTTDTFAMVYNKELFARAGLAGFPGTWEGLRAASKAIFQKTANSGWAFPAGACGTPAIWFFLNFYWWSHGWALVDEDASGKYFMRITSAQIADGLRYYRQYLTDGDDPKSMLGCAFGARPRSSRAWSAVRSRSPASPTPSRCRSSTPTASATLASDCRLVRHRTRPASRDRKRFSAVACSASTRIASTPTPIGNLSVF